MVSLHEGVNRADAEIATGSDIRFADQVGITPPPTDEELTVLSELHARTAAAHGESS